MKKFKKLFSAIMAVVLAVSTVMSAAPAVTMAASATVTSAGGWNETLYVELSGVSDSNVTAVSYSGASTGSLTGDDLKYLVRDVDGKVRIDIPGLKPGTYSVTVTTSSGTVTKSGIVVTEQDRSGYAHFNYTEGVGAYNDDGTLKKNAIVLYVTDENKNTVTLSYGGVTVTGIGNILNSVGQDVGGGKTNNGGAANSNQGILKLLAQNNIPLVVRFVGIVSNTGLYKRGTFNANTTPKINGLTIYDSTDNGGTEGDNGHMARMKSAKNVTLEGVGTGATIDGWGFHFMCETSAPELGKNFEVRNLVFINTPEDAVGMEGTQGVLSASGTVTGEKSATSDILGSVERCWVHNCEFYCPSISSPTEGDKSEGDGSVDFKRGQYFTCSYNYYEGCHKTNLVGSGDTSLQYNLTYHHNLYKYCEARGPLARRANIHMYNNAFIGQTSYAMDARANSFIFSESNIFYMAKAPQQNNGGIVKSYNDSFGSWLNSQGTIVKDKTTPVSNSCEFTYRGIDYSKFELDSKLSYIPSGDYSLNENHTEVMKDLYANAGAMKKDVISASEVSMSDISFIPSGVTVNDVTGSLPYTAVPGKVSKTVYAFKVDTAFDITMSASGGVLCNEAGVAFLEGSGTVRSLPAGTYMIQPVNFQPGSASALGEFKEITISSIEIKSADPNFDPNKLQSIALNKTSMTLVSSATATLSVTYTPSTTTADKTITWTTSNASVATVTGGVVKAVGKGTAVITAKVGDCTATCTVTVSDPVPLTGITLNKTSLELEAGQSDTLTVTCNPSNTTDNTDVSWSTGNSSVATVTDGVVKAVGEGTTTVTAKVGNFTATCTVKVTLPEVPEGAYIHVFDTVGTSSEFYSITGNTSTSKGTITYYGQTLKQCLKMESSTKITFTAPADGKLTLIFGGSTSASGSTVKVDGTSKSIDSTEKVTIDVKAGAHTIEKGGSINLWVIEYAPNSSGGGGSSDGHTHSYTSKVTKEATCTTAGVRTYTCSCGDTYTEAIAAAHNYSSSYTVDVQPTETTAGSKSRHCLNCDAKTDVTVIPATGSSSGGEDEPTPTPNPNPGDTTSAVKLVDVGGWLESAYVEWEPVSGATGYNVYIRKTSSNTYTQLDTELIRKYSGYWRADALGLAAGTYIMKVVPIKSGSAMTGTMTKIITVKAHDRSGYGWVNGTSSGAYNEDGTLKSGAKVVYITNSNAADMMTELTAFAKGTYPLAIRIIGEVKDASNLDKGDLLIDNKGNKVGLTIEGVGTDATCNGWGIRLKNSSNVEIRNLGVMNVDSSEGDNIGLQQTNDHIWVHNCDLFYGHAGSDKDQVKGDGALDTKKSHYVTHSYNHFWDSGKCNLQGASASDTSDFITYHHNWYDHSDSRHPRVRVATVHVYNNYYDGNSKYGIGSTTDSDIFAEANYFRNCKNPMMISKQGTDALGEGTFSGEAGGMIKAYNNYIEGAESFIPYSSSTGSQFDAYVATSRNEQVPSSVKASTGAGYNNFDTAADFYKYTADSPEDARINVVNYSGRMGGGDFQWEFNDAVDDASYDVNAELKAALVAYKTTLVSVGGNSVKMSTDNTGDVSSVEPGEGTNTSAGKELGNEDLSVLKSISLDKTSVALATGATTTLTVTYRPSNTTADKTVTWSTSSASVATVSNGVVTAVGTGTAVITAKVGELTATCTVTVSDPVPLTGITLNKTSLELEAGQNDTLTVTYNPSNTTDNTDVIWLTGNSSVATVTDGVVKAVSEGTTTITAKVGNFTATCTVKVTLPEVPEGAYIHIFDTAGTSSEFYSITGNTSTSKGTITYNGQTLKKCLKMESSTKITFTAPADGKLTLIFGGSTSASGSTVKVDGTSKSIDSTEKVTIDVKAGAHTIEKGGSINLWVIEYAPNSSSGGGSSDEHTHSYTSEVTKEATCTTVGIITNSCSCGESYTEIIPAKGHSYGDFVVDKEPTYTQDGSKSKHCSGCGHKIEITAIPKLECTDHTYKYSSTVTSATCTSVGEDLYVCTRCGAEDRVETPKLSHNFGEFVTDKEATYTEEGEKSRYCADCVARTEITVIPKLTCENHNYQYTSTEIEATCTTAGTEIHTCTVCKATKEVTVAKADHTYGDFVIDKAPTYKEAGEQSKHCSVCGNRTEITVMDKLVDTEHDYAYSSTEKEATCTSTGIEIHVCSKCDATKKIETAKTAHEYSANFTEDKAPTYTAPGEKSRHCENCDARIEITAIPKLVCADHDYEYTKTVREATCTSTGIELHTCTVCGGTKEITIEKADHTYGDFVIDKPSTATEAGEQSKHCSVCDHRTEITEIPKIGIIYGDINYSDEVSVADAVLLKKYLAGHSGLIINLAAADLNADGVVDTKDAVKLMKYLAGDTSVILGKA